MAGVAVDDLQARVRLVKRKEELEELLQDMEQRLDDGEAQIAAATAEKKKLLTNVQDLEEQYVLVVIPTSLVVQVEQGVRCVCVHVLRAVFHDNRPVWALGL